MRGDDLLPFLKMGTIFPIFQSRGRVAVDRDCEKIADKNKLEVCLVLFSTFVLILSNPAEEDIFKLAIILTIPDGEIVMSAIGA